MAGAWDEWGIGTWNVAQTCHHVTITERMCRYHLSDREWLEKCPQKVEEMA